MTRLSLLALLCFAPVSAHTDGAADGLDRLRALEGQWVLVDPGGEATTLRAQYENVAAGSGVIETLFVDTPEETVTVYHLEGRRVTATQLSGRGVPARFVPGESEDRQALALDTAAIDPGPDDVTRIAVTFTGDDQLRIDWTFGSRSRQLELRRDTDVRVLAGEARRLRSDLDDLVRRLDVHLKREVELRDGDARPVQLLETRTLPPAGGWSVTGVPFRMHLQDQTTVFASTFASEGDPGMTLAHYPFEAGPDCRVTFSVLGGHAYVAVVEESKAPPRKVSSIADFAVDLEGGEYGVIVERIVGRQYKEPRAVEWDLSRFEGKPLRLYVVDAQTNHYGQIAVSEFRITERARER